jgi:hypothetical protein
MKVRIIDIETPSVSYNNMNQGSDLYKLGSIDHDALIISAKYS